MAFAGAGDQAIVIWRIYILAEAVCNDPHASVSGIGGYAEKKCLPESGGLATMPANMAFEQAAALHVGGLTALHFLRKGDVRDGKKILIYGASGSVGSFGGGD